MARSPAVYVVDAQDRVASVNDAWAEFAAEGGAPDLADQVVGQPLWEFIAGEQTEAIYRELFERVRRGATITLPYRCDSPTRVRECELELAPRGEGAIVCTTRYIAEYDQPPVPLHDPDVERTEEFLRMCSWCKRVQLDEWVAPEEAVRRLGLFVGGPVPFVTHGICDDCLREMLDTL
jgi:hypothetical protein